MKTFLSIGTGPGIGAETAKRFASEGFRLVITARNADGLEKIATELRSTGAEVHPRTVDAADADAVADLVAGVEKDFGAIDVLHYNAAKLRHATVQDQPVASFNADLAVNIGGALAAVNAASGAMSGRGAGTILLTGGGLAMTPHPEYLSISIGKAGIRALAQGTFAAFREKGVHVATVTVAGFVNPGSEHVVKIANHFWVLHAQAPAEWTVETIYTP